MIQHPSPDAAAESLRLLPLHELRGRRATLVEEETGLSYLRRMVQGPLDIVRGELSRRVTGGGSDLAGLVDDLPNLLSGGEGRSTGMGTSIDQGTVGLADPEHAVPIDGGRLPEMIGPPQVDPQLATELEAMLSEAPVEAVTQLDEPSLVHLVAELESFEKKVSEQRRSLHGQIDAVGAELTRRYRSGEADVETLLD